MTSTNANMHQKLVKNGLLKQKNLLPEEFIDHNDMLDSYGNESLERFKSQNLSIWGDLGLGAAVKPRQVLLSGDKKYLILVYKERHINIYNFITKHSAVGPNTSISPEDLKFEGVITCAAFCEVTRHLFVGSLNGEIVRIDLNSDNIKQSITPIKSSAKTSISSMDVSDDGQTLAYCHFGEVTTLDLFTFKEQHHRQNDRHYKSAYFVGTEQQNLLITKVRRAILDSGYEIRARTGAEKTPKKKVVGAQLMRPPEYAKLTQNKKHYLTLRNGTSNSGKPYTECQVFRIDNHDDPIRTFMLEHHVTTDFDKLQFNITNDEIYLFCFSASENALYIHDFTNKKSTTECGKIPFKDYQYAAFADDDSCLVLVDGDGKVAVCDLFIDADRILSQHMLNFFEGKKDSLEISNGGEYVAYFQRNQDLEVLDLKRNKVILNLQITENYRELVSASIKFSDDKLKDEIVVEYKVVFEQDPENVREYLIQEKLPPQGSDPVYLSINLEERKPKHIEHIEHEAENGREETDQFVSPHLKFENAHSIRDLGDLPIPIIHLNHRSKPIETHLDQIDVWDNKSLTSIPLKPQQKEELKFAVKSSNEKYLFIANKDSTVDVYTFPVLQYICSWKNSRERNLVSIKVQKDDKFILLAYGDGHVEKRDFNFTPRSSLGNETKFYSFQRYLRLDKIPLIEGLQRPQNYHISSDQTILHLKALANTGDGFVDLVYRSDLKVPFLRDSYNKTPLHYILYHKKIDYGDLDALATYVLEYMSVLKEENEDEYQKVLESLNKLIPILVLDLEPGLATKYVKMVAPIEEVCMEKVGINLFAENRTVYFPGNDFDKVHKRALDTLVDGQEKMLFKKLDLKIDYTPHSKDILKYAIALAELKVEDLFKVPAIAHLVDYIWISTKGWTFLLFIWFSVLMILLSLCVAIGERTYGLEITILVFTSIGMAIEVMQFAVLRLRYWKSLWNNMDLICLVLIYIYIIFKLTDFEDQLTENWIAAFMIFLGYLRWAAYLRLFERTRQLIEVIVAITKDMGSFLIIMLLITFGFSIIFLKFLREDQDYYLWHLYYSYQLWYGNTDGIPSNSPSVLILECAIMFIMPVVLLNLLVTLMGESRETVRENAILTDSRTRLAMSIEAISLKRAIYYILVPSSRTQMKTERKEKRKKQKSHNPNKTSLFVCVPKSKDKECEEMNKRENDIANLQAQVKSILETLEASKESAKKDRENIELKAVEMIQTLKDSQEDQAQKFRKLEEQARKNLLILQEQARKSERLEAQNKDNENKYKEPDHQEFEAIKQLMRDMKTELRLHIVGETDQIKYHMKEYMDKIDKALTKTEAEPTTKNEFANGAEEEDYERND